METKELQQQPQTGKSIMEELRAIRDQMSLEMQDMTVDEIREYLRNKETLHPKSFWEKYATP